MLTENYTGPLYHFTRIRSAIKILQDKEIKGRIVRHDYEDEATVFQSVGVSFDKYMSVSFARSMNSGFIREQLIHNRGRDNGIAVVFVVDPTRLKKHTRGSFFRSLSFYGIVKKPVHFNDQEANEQEERFFAPITSTINITPSLINVLVVRLDKTSEEEEELLETLKEIYPNTKIYDSIFKLFTYRPGK